MSTNIAPTEQQQTDRPSSPTPAQQRKTASYAVQQLVEQRMQIKRTVLRTHNRFLGCCVRAARLKRNGEGRLAALVEAEEMQQAMKHLQRRAKDKYDDEITIRHVASQQTTPLAADATGVLRFQNDRVCVRVEEGREVECFLQFADMVQQYEIQQLLLQSATYAESASAASMLTALAAQHAPLSNA